MTVSCNEPAEASHATEGSYTLSITAAAVDIQSSTSQGAAYGLATLAQVIRLIGAEGLDRRGPAGSCRRFLALGFGLGLVGTVSSRR